MQIAIGEAAGGAVVRGQHADEPSGTADQGRGLDGANAGGQQYIQGRRTREYRASAHVVNYNSLAGLQGGAACNVTFADLLEEFKERTLEAASRHNRQHARAVFKQLDVALVG